MNLKHFTDKELHSSLKFLVSEERKLSLKILHHLREIDRRRLYCDHGHSSLFDYAIKQLGYSGSSAYRRVLACRMLTDVPEIEERIEGGHLNLSQLTDAANFFRDNKITNPKRKKEILKKVEGLSKKETSTLLDEMTGKVTKRLVSVPLSEETITKIEKWRGFQSAKQTQDELISKSLDITIAQAERYKFKLVNNPGPGRPGIGVMANTKRTVAERDGRKCTNCGSTNQLQYDHRMPKALGGSNSSENIRLLCFACNQRARIRAGL